MKYTNIKNKEKPVYFLIFLIPFLMGLGVDLYVPSLPTIEGIFHTNIFFTQLTVSLYLLGYGIGQIFLGILSDFLGRRKILVFSSFLFTLISFLCILSQNIITLDSLRFLQGLSMAGLSVIIRAAMVDVFQSNDLKKASNYFTLSWSLGPIIAPFIGSYLSEYISWKANFYLFLFYGCFVFLYSLIRFKETNLSHDNITSKNLFNNLKSILSTKTFISLSLISSLSYGVIVIFNSVGPFFIESTLKYTIKSYGEIAMFLGLGYFFGATLNRFLISKFNHTKILKFGLISSLILGIIMIILAFIFNLSLFTLVIPIFFLFLSIGFIVPNALSSSMTLFPHSAGTASALFGTITGIIVFILTTFSSEISFHSMIPLSVTYFLIFFISLILFLFATNLKKIH